MRKYHERRINRLHESHSMVDLETVRGDYYARLKGYGGMEIFMPTTDGRTFDYDLDLMCAVDESLSKRLEQFFSDVVYTVTNS